MTRNSISIIALFAAAALCGCATTSGNQAPKPTPTACNTSTGSRLPAGPGCASPGRTYTQTDLNQTGQTTVAGALGMVDPSLTISH
jgi:hypothetical protein